ncbi:putative peptidoglycan binding protein [Alkalibaculum bacchi]|uniref:Putative peptidoglycan binding protein n=1 Tax=Alkalibaculum bacchi TaxID=645887 RepID=A0A366IHA5_9FIRM|nr:peptidoglycan-binding protein [Alkalibaculum bacchi]RBP70220.1 putative peptidoglycan binding protein [Alkalibaculum bacchi]
MKKSVKVLSILLLILIVFSSSAFAVNYLGYGMRGSGVNELQNNLKALGYLDINRTTDYYGTQTRDAVIAFQRDNGLKADGYFGPASRVALENVKTGKQNSESKPEPTKPEASTPPKTSTRYPRVLKYAMSGTDVKELQEDLKSLGYLKINNTTNYFGTMTVDALKAFQRSSAIGVDGSFGPQTRTTLLKALEGTSSSLPNRGDETSTATKINAVIATAKSYIGVPYAMGGSTPKAFDCSGYTQYIMKQNGMSVTRTAASQYNEGTSVSRSNLQRGDFVFFETYKAGASHVGIYLGNNEFISATSSSGVRITKLTDNYWNTRYIGARRIIK